MSLLSDPTNFSNTSSTLSPSLGDSIYYDNSTWPPGLSSTTPVPVDGSNQSSGGGCVDNCVERDDPFTRFIVGTMLLLFAVALLFRFMSRHGREQDA